MEKSYSVTYKVAPNGAKYIYQEDKREHKAGEAHPSKAGHMWYVLRDGSNSKSYGFESRYGEMHGEGRVTIHDDAAYQQSAQC